MGYQPILVDTAISGSVRTILRLEGISLAPNGVESGTLDVRGLVLPSGQLLTPSDGVMTLTNGAGTSFTRLQLGGTTSSFPALKRNGSQVDFRRADDSIYTGIAADYLALGAKIILTQTAPTISSGFGTSPSIVANNGPAAFSINVGSGGVASSGVIGLPITTNGWIVWVQNLTAQAAGRAAMSTTAGITYQTATTTTTATITNLNLNTGGAVAWAANDILHVSCFPF